MSQTRVEDGGKGEHRPTESTESDGSPAPSIRSSPDSDTTVVNDRSQSQSTSTSDVTVVNERQDLEDIIRFSNVNAGTNSPDEQTEKDQEVEVASPPPPYRYSGTSYDPPRPYRHEKLCQLKPGMMDHPSITFGGPMIVLFDIVVPCIIYYTWYNTRTASWNSNCEPYISKGETCPLEKPEFDKDILGYAIISFGIGELYILLARVYRLFYHSEECAPLLSRAPWELDATSWVYGVAMICALIPFVVGSTMVIPHLYLYSPAFLMAFLGLLMLATLFPIPIPIGINSHSRGGGIRPFIYYAAEDFIAVDGLQGRDFRIRYNARYENSPAFRRLFTLLTIWWIIGVVVYIVCLSAVIWTIEFHYAFGLSLGILFAYIATWAATSYIFVSLENKLEYDRAKDAGILADVAA